MQTGFPGAQLALSGGQGMEEVTLDAEQAVPVAVVTSELMVNAIKHGASAPIVIEVSRAEGASCIRVINRLVAGRGAIAAQAVIFMDILRAVPSCDSFGPRFGD